LGGRRAAGGLLQACQFLIISRAKISIVAYSKLMTPTITAVTIHPSCQFTAFLHSRLCGMQCAQAAI
jgi:hypothetical protein